MGRIETRDTKSMKHEEITGEILSAAFAVSKELGHGFLEAIYEKAMLMALRQAGLKAENQYPIKVRFREVVIGDYAADILVENKVIVELKAVKALAPEHLAQVINYLKATGFEVGMLTNFGVPKIEYKRLSWP